MTKEQIEISGILSPGLLDGEVMSFLPAGGNAYYVKRFGEEAYQKDKKGGYLKITYQKVLSARFAYLKGHFEEEKEAAIQKEYEKLGKGVVEKANEVIKHIAELTHWANTGDVFFSVIREHNPNQADSNKRNAQDFFARNPNALTEIDRLKALIEQSDYEAIYHALGMSQSPIFVGKHNAPTLSRLFSAVALESTIADLQEKGPLYLLAKVNVDKRYFPS